MKSFVSFTEFFRALYSHDPFPWQRILADRGAAGEWPEAISLPTASGKTACLDAAIYALAAQAALPLAKRKAPRRIWFVVDRRIVVDEAHDRALNLAARLSETTDGPIRVVAERLRSLISDPDAKTSPLGVARLRGGTTRNDTWAHDPSQPAILCSTVDQIGSGLLFRSYGHDPLTASIWAGLAAHDSLILLDEAHCAVPFLQTVRAIASYRGTAWASEPVETPFACTVFSATLPPGIAAEIPSERRLPRDSVERAVALKHPLLNERMTASKPTTLVVAPKAKKEEPRSTLAAEIVRHTKHHLDAHCAQFREVPRIAVMVNRVATAAEVAALLSAEYATTGEPSAHVLLLTGRMRPLERDALVAKWSPMLRSGAGQLPDRPLIVVTTQCLEVGADFSFDALVTECASLDALRQRFGRLDRLGKFRRATATLVITEADTKEPKSEDDNDPIYGRAIYETWHWLQSIASATKEGPTVDFGINAMDAFVEKISSGKSGSERLAALHAPSLDAPILLPAHLDLLCQTAPQPEPDPDIALFLHGKRPQVPEVRVLWRTDLPETANPDEQTFALECLALVPPAAAETISVPLHRLKTWLAQRASALDEGDVEGRSSDDSSDKPITRDQSRPRVARFITWAGADHSRVCTNPRELKPGDTVVLPATTGLDGLAQAPGPYGEGLGPGRIDLAESAALAARPHATLRVCSDLWSAWELPDSFRALLASASADDFDRDEFFACWETVRREPPTKPTWLPGVVAALGDTPRIEQFDDGRGVILIGPRKNSAVDEDDYADEVDAWSRVAGFKNDKGITLAHHSADVATAARRFATACLPSPLQAAADLAAPVHDLGKLDPRFQVILHDGDESAAQAAIEAGLPLAKSADLPRRKRRRHSVEQAQRLPRGFRHELLSVELVEQLGLLPSSSPLRDLALHLIASHHGHARPTVPEAPDAKSPAIDLTGLGLSAQLESTGRVPAGPFGARGSRIAGRFWKLTRRHGWWGLAYLEATFRLADWRASGQPSATPKTPPRLGLTRSVIASSPSHHLTLSAIDGANPLGFLAALGVLRIATLKRGDHEPALSWVVQTGRIVPRLTTTKPLTKEALVTLLVERLTGEHVFPLQITRNPDRQKLKIEVEALRECISAIATEEKLRDFAAFWAAFFNETSPRDGTALKTRFDFHSGQMKIVENVAALRRQVDASILNQTLFDGWRYIPQPSLRWDPLDEKRLYALQANDPSNKPRNPILTEIGANLLAVEGLHYFPMAPDRFGSQAGFNRARYAEEWSWPLWDEPLTADATFSLLQSRREGRGNVRLFRSRMGEAGKGYRSFSPARPV